MFHTLRSDDQRRCAVAAMGFEGGSNDAAASLLPGSEVAGRLAGLGDQMNASSVSFRAGVVLAIVGVSLGIYMGMSQDHRVSPAHGHLNLLGWVSLFLIGTYYRLHPALDASRIALIQVSLWTAGSVVLPTGIAAIYLGQNGEPLTAVGSILILIALLMFAYYVWRPSQK